MMSKESKAKEVVMYPQDVAALQAILQVLEGKNVQVTLNYKCNIVGRVELHDEAQFAQRDIHNTIGSNNSHSGVDVVTPKGRNAV